MPTARLKIIGAKDPANADKVTVTIEGPQTPNTARILKVLSSLFYDGTEWDGPMPNVELIAQREIDAEA